MSQHAVKIGEIHLVSDKPITEEQREAALAKKDEWLNRGCYIGPDVNLDLAVNGH